MKLNVLVLLLAVAMGGCGSVTAVDPHAEENVRAELDDFHHAASVADEERYFGHFAPDGVFLGTDATERWTTTAFRAYAHPYFSQGKGWTFTPRSRNVTVSRSGSVAWFDERLDSASYGECRGSGVLQKVNGRWLVEQYNLTIPIPNDLAKEFVGRIRDFSTQPPK